MRIFLATLIILHGFAHVVGFAGAFRLSSDMPYKTTLLSGRVDVGDVGIRAVGALWLLAAIAFVLIGLAGYTNQEWWMKAGISLAAVSLLLCMTELPEARIGMAINTIIIIGMIGAYRTGWL